MKQLICVRSFVFFIAHSYNSENQYYYLHFTVEDSDTQSLTDFQSSVLSIGPCCLLPFQWILIGVWPPAFLFPYKDEAQVENSLILTALYCFESTEFTDDNSRREKCFYLLFLILRSWNCCSDYQSVVPDTSFIIIQRGKMTAKKSILLIIHMCSKSDGSNLCPFIQYSIFKQIQKLPRHLTV